MRRHKARERSSFHTENIFLFIVTIFVRHCWIHVVSFHFNNLLRWFVRMIELLSVLRISVKSCTTGFVRTHTSLNEEFWKITSCHEDVLHTANLQPATTVCSRRV